MRANTSSPDTATVRICTPSVSKDSGFALKDATDSFTEEDYNYGIKYLKETYGAEISDVDSILKML